MSPTGPATRAWHAITHWLARTMARASLRAPDTHAAVGRRGERIAERHLRRQGYRVLGRNLVIPGHAPIGGSGGVRAEADLVCLDPDGRTIVVVEVKSRVAQVGVAIAPEAQVHEHKRRHLRLIARRLIRANGWEGRPIRIDVVAVDFEPGARAVREVRHHRWAVGA